MEKQYCEIFTIQKNHYGKKRWKRCRCIAIKVIEDKKVCIHHFNKLNPSEGVNKQ